MITTERMAAGRRTFSSYVCITLTLCAALPGAAHAVVKGTPSALGPHLVRIQAGHFCSGVAIARRKIATARHCVSPRMRIVAGGVSIGVAAIVYRAQLDDGRHISVSGDAAIVRLAAPLPASVVPLTVGEGQGDSYTIAGFGTANESRRGALGTLREAHLVAAEPRALVDPKRTGSIGASACFGDSGGAVLRGTALIGVISRAAHPHPRIACGHLTRWVPITVSGVEPAPATLAVTEGKKVDEPRAPRRKAVRKRGFPTTNAFAHIRIE